MDGVPTTSQVLFPTRKATLNYVRICRLITGICTELCRILFSKHIPPDDLIKTLKANKSKIDKAANKDEKKIVDSAINSKTNLSLTVKFLDFCLMFKILKILGFIKPHANGWNNFPQEDDTSIAACMDIILYYRHKNYGHIAKDEIVADDFDRIWDKIKCAVVEIERKLIGGSLFQDAVDNLADWNINQPEEIQHETKKRKCGFYDDMGAKVRFDKLFDEIAEKIPRDKLEHMKDIIQNTCEGVNTLDKKDARGCLRIIRQANYFTSTDVIYMQYVLKRIGCEELFVKCFEFAKEQDALCFHTKPTANGLIIHIHVCGNMNNYKQDYIEVIKQTVADIVGCSTEEIQFGGICPSYSFLVVLSLKSEYKGKLLTLEQQDKDKLSRLNIDYFIADLNFVFLERSKDLESKWEMYFGPKTQRTYTNTDTPWKETKTSMPILEEKPTTLITESQISREKYLKIKSESDSSGDIEKCLTSIKELRDDMEISLTSIKELQERVDKLEEAPGKRKRPDRSAEKQPKVIFMEDTFVPPSSANLTSTFAVPNLSAIGHIAYVKPRSLWVAGDSTLMQIDLAGNLIQTVDDALCYHGCFAVTENGDLFYIGKDQHSIRRKSSVETSTIVDLPNYVFILCICISHKNGNLLVVTKNDLNTQRHRVVRYDTKENISHVVLDDSIGDPYKSPVYITENRNGDIVVSDQGNKAVIVVNSAGQNRFIIKKRNSGFLPCGLATDDNGNILVVEGHKETYIYVFDQDGILTRRLSEKSDRWWGVCLDDKQNLYVGNRKGKIDVYSY